VYSGKEGELSELMVLSNFGQLWEKFFNAILAMAFVRLVCTIEGTEEES